MKNMKHVREKNEKIYKDILANDESCYIIVWNKLQPLSLQN